MPWYPKDDSRTALANSRWLAFFFSFGRLCRLASSWCPEPSSLRFQRFTWDRSKFRQKATCSWPSSSFACCTPLLVSILTYLQSSILRNTEWIIGLGVYSGPETKVGLNVKLPPSKFSSLDKKLNSYIALIFVFKICLCLIMGLANLIFNVHILMGFLLYSS